MSLERETSVCLRAVAAAAVVVSAPTVAASVSTVAAVASAPTVAASVSTAAVVASAPTVAAFGLDGGGGTTGSGDYCGSCTTSSDCATGGECLCPTADPRCTTGFCGTECTSNSDCQTGAECSAIEGGGHQCYPTSGACSGSGSGGSGYCTECTEAQQWACPGSDICIVQSNHATTGFCAPPCTTRSDCESTAECNDMVGGADGGYCTPKSGSCN